MLKNIAPAIFRQRLIIEGYYTIAVDGDAVEQYLLELAARLQLRTYGEPIVFSPGSGMGKQENAGFDAFVPLIDSGISIYVWSEAQFFSAVLYTCKGFEEQVAIEFSRDYFAVTGELVSASF